MKERAIRYCLLFFAMMVAFCPDSRADSDEESKLLDAIEVLHEINRIPENAIAPHLLKNAHGIAIVPGVIKLGFVVAGRHGQGVICVRNASGGWSNPSFVTLTGGSVGWQAGAQSTDVILVFKSRKSVDAIARGKFTLGADASVAAGPVGRHAEAGTDIQLKSEIYSYSRNRGLFAGVAWKARPFRSTTQPTPRCTNSSTLPRTRFSTAPLDHLRRPWRTSKRSCPDTRHESTLPECGRTRLFFD